jgi:hypothetical protein
MMRGVCQPDRDGLSFALLHSNAIAPGSEPGGAGEGSLKQLSQVSVPGDAGESPHDLIQLSQVRVPGDAGESPHDF